MRKKNGTGFRLPQGFSRTGRTGYAQRENLYGCQQAWNGKFADKFNYTASASIHQTTFGEYWNVEPDGGATYSLTASGNGILIGSGGAPIAIYPSCASIPQLGKQFAELNSNQNGVATFANGGGPAIGTPLYAGGPAAMEYVSGGHYFSYALDASNQYVDPVRDLTHCFRVTLNQYEDGNPTPLDNNYILTGGFGSNGSGWQVGTVPLRIEVIPGVGSNVINVYSGTFGSPFFTYTDSSGFGQLGKFGIHTVNFSAFSNYVAGTF